MPRIVSKLAVLFVMTLAATGCKTLEHQVGTGAQGGADETERQWYILWGLVPLNEVDSHEMAAGATNYTITSEESVVDIIISLFTTWVTIVCKSVTVER